MDTCACRRNAHPVRPRRLTAWAKSPPKISSGWFARTDDFAHHTCSAVASLAVTQAVHQGFLLAAIDFDLGAIDHVHQWRSQHDHQRGNFLDFGYAADRDRSRGELVCLVVTQLHI